MRDDAYLFFMIKYLALPKKLLLEITKKNDFSFGFLLV